MLKKLIKMIGIYLFSTYARKVANDYWQNTTVTHSKMEEEQFDFYYNELIKLIKPEKNSKILDYGGGNGEIAYKFQKNGYNIYHCDISKKMVNNAKGKFNLKSCECKEMKGKFDIILIHNAFFYIHPKLQEKYLKHLFSLLKENGTLFITDTPDFSKRFFVKNNYKWYEYLYLFLARFFPVYQIDLAGFYIKHKDLSAKAKKAGFKTIKKLDSWSSYRSHWILRR